MNTTSKNKRRIFYKEFRLSYFPYLILFWISMFLVFSLVDEGRKLSPVQAIIGGTVCAIIFHLPSYLSALIMNWRKKPILELTKNGIYYSPQIWSKDEFCFWKEITLIRVVDYSTNDSEEDNSPKIYIDIYCDDLYMSISERLLPINYEQVLKYSREYSPQISIETNLWRLQKEKTQDEQ